MTDSCCQARTESGLESDSVVIARHVVEPQCAATLLTPVTVDAVEGVELGVQLKDVRFVLLARLHLTSHTHVRTYSS